MGVIPHLSKLGPAARFGAVSGPFSTLAESPVGAVPRHYSMRPAAGFGGVDGRLPLLAEGPVDAITRHSRLDPAAGFPKVGSPLPFVTEGSLCAAPTPFLAGACCSARVGCPWSILAEGAPAAVACPGGLLLPVLCGGVLRCSWRRLLWGFLSAFAGYWLALGAVGVACCLAWWSPLWLLPPALAGWDLFLHCASPHYPWGARGAGWDLLLTRAGGQDAVAEPWALSSCGPLLPVVEGPLPVLVGQMSVLCLRHVPLRSVPSAGEVKDALSTPAVGPVVAAPRFGFPASAVSVGCVVLFHTWQPLVCERPRGRSSKPSPAGGRCWPAGAVLCLA